MLDTVFVRRRAIFAERKRSHLDSERLHGRVDAAQWQRRQRSAARRRRVPSRRACSRSRGSARRCRASSPGAAPPGSPRRRRLCRRRARWRGCFRPPCRRCRCRCRPQPPEPGQRGMVHQSPLNGDGGPDGTARVIVRRPERAAEDHDHAVAEELGHDPALTLADPLDGRVVRVQDAHDVLDVGRCAIAVKPRRSTNIAVARTTVLSRMPPRRAPGARRPG